ncbi:FHA domain-containing protein [Oscillatoria salina]|uniref:FHA domain-containing protein n=1 Tax=Oscillatoria salina TaxID=331517 RepID=UPI0013BB0903|nr:FHA domain-containing protein [Oscillatoria salina]MBZ8181332.1 FHA domain-containing protein [Oscillatoria salina IIICB1]NET87816.1 FHA domain-containing protein [Kamptonema sp. SIO1D9]
MEIEHRLGLYQVFLKLYEHNRSLLDEILQLENTRNRNLTRFSPQYVVGVVEKEQVYLVTNLLKGKTQKILQPEKIWTIGRAKNLAFSIFDERLSRHHAVIKYLDNQGFYLVDLDSTNGTYVNHEPVHEPILLKEGDRVRLGTITFSFFLCEEVQSLNPVPQEVLAKLSHTTSSKSPGKKAQAAVAIEDKDTDLFLKNRSRHPSSVAGKAELELSQKQRSQMLDRFFERQKSN